MANVDELIVQIKADTRDLNNKLGKLEGQVKKASNSKGMTGLGLSLRSLKGPAIAATAALAGMAAVSVPLIRTGAALEDMKISLNTVFGSARAGQKQFDNILKFATESPFQVTDLTQAFIQLGSAGIKPTEEMMKTFAGAASVTIDSLGAFQALVRITQRSASGGLGLEELNQLSDRGIPVFEILAKKIGVTRDQISALGSTSDGAKKIMEALNEGLKEQFGEAVDAKMGSLNQKFSNLETAFQNISAAMFDEAGLGSAMKKVVGFITSAVNGLAKLVRMASSGMSSEFLDATTDEERVKILTEEVALLEKRDARYTGAGTKRQLDEKRNALKILKEMIVKDAEQLVIDEKKTKKTKEETAAIIAQNQANMDRADRIENLAKLIQSTVPETEVLATKIKEIEDIIAKGDEDELSTLLGGRDAPESLRLLKERLDELKDPIEETAKLFNEDMIQAIVNTTNAFTNDFVNALLSGQNVLESFKNFARNIVSQIIATFLQLAVVNRILNVVFSSFDGFTPLDTIGFGGGGGGGGGGKLGTVMGNGSQYAGFAASGGSLQRGRATVVGERGPELIIPNTGGTVMNAHSTRMQGGAGIVINQSLNFATGVVPTVRQEVMKMLPTISDVTKASVLEAASRGGTYRRGLLGG